MQGGKEFYKAPNGDIVSDDPDYLKNNNKAITWKQYLSKGTNSQKNFIMTPDGTLVSEDPNFLK